MGPLTRRDGRACAEDQAPDRSHVDVEWTSLAGYLQHAEQHGVSQNIASYIGATTLRQLRRRRRRPPGDGAELDTMRGLVRDEMSAGALGIGSSLIYPPAFFASTEELIELCRAASPYGGKYISHMRNEGDELARSRR